MPAHKFKPLAKLQLEPLDVVDQFLFKLGLATWDVGAKEIEKIGVFEYLRGEIGIRRRKCGEKTVLSPPFPLVKFGFHVDRQDISTPALLNRFLGVPKSHFSGGGLFQEREIRAPWYLGNDALHYFQIRPSRHELTHVFEVSGGEPSHFREQGFQVLREAIDDFSAPAFALLALQNGPPKSPIKQNHG